jgi:NitT/TauT family transport system ATP-binding protein
VSQIDVRHLTQEYDAGDRRITALRDVSFTVGASEFVCVLGQSGCGKTTLLNLLAGFLAPTQGEILVGGQAVSGKGGDRGIVFQDFAQLFPWRTAQRNVEFGLEMRNVPAAERREIALRYLRLVKLEAFAAAYPHQLSGGMQQRVAIARALAYEPSVLLMDEPFAALDAMTREEMQRLLVEVWQKTRKTVVYVTHNVAEAVYHAERIVVLTPHPGTVKAELKVALPRLRDPLLVEFLEYQREVIAHLTSRHAEP